MTTPLRRRLRRVRRVVAYGVATLLILAALAVAIINQFLPWLSRHPEDVAQWLTQRVGRPVALEQVDARWSRSGPLLQVTGLRIGEGEDALDIGRAELQIHAYAGFLPSVPLTTLRVRGLDLELTRRASGEWKLEGLSANRRGEDFDPRQLDGLGEVQIEAARLRVSDEISARVWSLRRIDARLRTVGARFRLGVVAQIDDHAPLQLVAELDRKLRDGQLWLGGENLMLAPWLGGTPLAGVEVLQADGDIGVWLKFADRRLVSAQMEANLAPLSLRGGVSMARDPASADARAPDPNMPDADAIDRRYDFDRAAASLRWQLTDAGWRADVAQLDFELGETRTSTAGVHIEQGEKLRLRASELELGPLLALAALTDRPSPALQRWLLLAEPHGKLTELALNWSDAAAYRASGRLDGLGWNAVGKIPGLTGISGTFDADAVAATLALATGRVEISAPGSLRAPLTPNVSGTLNAFALQPGWRIEAAGLQFRGEDYGFALDGGVELQGDGTRPLLDLRADIEPGPITAAKHFWITNKMPPQAVKWLDDALRNGRIVRARALVRGDADHWPFRDHEGRLEAEVELAETQLRYRHDWPDGTDVAGIARFINEAIEIDLTGRILDNRIERVTGGIAVLKEPILALDVTGGGSGPALLALLRASPLQKTYGNYLDGLEVGGEGAVKLAFHLPLKPTLGRSRIDGHVDLQRADLRDSKWDLAFGAASGRVRFSDSGFSADELNVGFADALATLSIAVGAYTSDESRVAEASLRGNFDSDALLEPYPDLHWLKPWMDGKSDWTLQLNVPRDASSNSLQRLRVRSDLVGTALSLPAPLRKDASDRLALDLGVDLPLAQGSIDLRLGELLRLRGRLPQGGSFNGVAMFGDAPEEAPPAAGLIAVGQVPVLDAAGWAAFALSGSGSGAGLQRADIYAGELDVLDRGFAETRLTFTREGDGTLALGFAGAVLQGSLQIPTIDIASRGITARFERLHWPSQAPSAAAAPTSGNPAAVPPLHLHIEDFRFGDAALGETRLETYPTPEGLHVDRLDTTSKDLTIRATGDWTLIDQRERSNFRLAFSAPDLGAMLKALGFSELIEGGQTQAELKATWPGAPAAFELQRVDGTLTAKVGKGRVLEVKPGAGRLFGLLSLSEIPRRLALDFSDFFESGLAFNEITGSFVLDGGNATTDDLRIDGPAAEIRVRGRTGLKAKDYDQTMEVLPRPGSMLPALGALAAGPAGAALGAVAQVVLQQPLKQMARKLYRVQGSWAEPKIEVIDRGPARVERNARRADRVKPALPAPLPTPAESLRTR